MKIFWSKLTFKHECGREGAILEVAMTRIGVLSLSGVCATCGEEFEVQCSMLELISRCAVEDYNSEKEGCESVDLDKLMALAQRGKVN